MRRAWLALVTLAIAACNKPAPSDARFRIEVLGPAEVHLLPNAGQLPYCLAFTASDRGVVRLLTMSPSNTAPRCETDKPIGGVSYRIPPDEGPVRLVVVFADQDIEASSIAAQVRDLTFKQRRISGMDLRAPGTVTVDMLDFSPKGP